MMLDLKLLLVALISTSLSVAGVLAPRNGTDVSSISSPSTDASTFTFNNATYTYQDAWCIYQKNAASVSFALVLPNDGSATEDGIDGRCDCGQKLRDSLNGQWVAISQWHCHYGPENSACVTFDTALLTNVDIAVDNSYIDVENKDVTCQPVKENVVCPKTFPNGKNAGC